MELSAGGAKRDVENTPKGTCLNCILPRRSNLGLATVDRLLPGNTKFLFKGKMFCIRYRFDITKEYIACRANPFSFFDIKWPLKCKYGFKKFLDGHKSCLMEPGTGICTNAKKKILL